MVVGGLRRLAAIDGQVCGWGSLVERAGVLGFGVFKVSAGN